MQHGGVFLRNSLAVDKDFFALVGNAERGQRRGPRDFGSSREDLGIHAIEFGQIAVDAVKERFDVERLGWLVGVRLINLSEKNSKQSDSAQLTTDCSRLA